MSIDPDAALRFLFFAAERHRIWQQRYVGLDGPWTDDPVLSRKKFTNAFRIIDHDSQWLVKNLIDPDLDDRTQLMRLFLFRHTGRVNVWENTYDLLGEWPTLYNFNAWASHFKLQRTDGASVFTNAYLVYPQSSTPGTDKVESIFDLTWRLMSYGSTVSEFISAHAQHLRFHALRQNKGVGDFMSMQILTDWGYTPHCGEDRENEFIVLGPGALKGARALAPAQRPFVTFEWAVKAVRALPDAPRLPDGRELSLMDVQNLLCESSKLARYDATPVSKLGVQYQPQHPGELPKLVLPDHW